MSALTAASSLCARSCRGGQSLAVVMLFIGSNHPLELLRHASRSAPPSAPLWGMVTAYGDTRCRTSGLPHIVDVIPNTTKAAESNTTEHHEISEYSR